MTVDEFVCVVSPHITGRRNAVSITYLAKILKMSERKVRSYIEEANTSGKCMIVNMQDRAGYFIPAEDERYFLSLYKAQEAKRFNSLKDKLEGMNIFLESNKPKKPNELEDN